MITDERADKHTKKMEEKYGTQIEISVAGTKEYFSKDYVDLQGIKRAERDMEIIFENKDVSDVVMKYGGANSAVLNFASYGRPGSMYTLGGIDQEADLCNHSFLYNVLAQFDEYYKWNRSHANCGMGRKHALYVPYVVFEKNGETRRIDVISSSIQNWNIAKTYGFTNTQNMREFKERIALILRIAEEHGITTLILGAWGCGSLGHDTTAVARAFRDVLVNHRSFNQIVFAIPGSACGSDSNLQRFKSVFSHFAIGRKKAVV